MVNEKLKSKKTIYMIVILNLIIFGFISFICVIFYYKYSSAISTNTGNQIKRTEFIFQMVKKDFIDSNYNEDKAKELLQRSILSGIYLLKHDQNRKLNIIATSDLIYQNDLFSSGGCDGLQKHDFDTNYFQKEIMSENRIKICMFERVGDYILGVKQFFTHSISGSKDPDFKEWAIKNLTPSVFTISILAFFIALISIWVLNIYFSLKIEYIENRIKFKKSLKNIKDQLYMDPVTKLSNKSALMNDIRSLSKPKVVVIDIDDFGRMNDYYGRENCDKILIYIANLIKEFAKMEKMKAYCIGADRFALVENEDFFIDRYEELANELIGKFKGRMITIKDSKTNEIIEVEVHTTIGFALDKDDTLMKATTALKIAKKFKKDYVCYFKGLNQKDDYADQIERSNMIRHAIINNNIVPFYQPIFNASGEIIKYESLVRILDSDVVVSPHMFLDTSKRIKRYAELQKMVITKNIEKLAENEKLILSVNLSGRDMIDGDVSVTILKLLNEYNVADRIIFELVEDENLENVERIENFIDKVKGMGVKIAIDDFGSGYSNFSYIIKLKPDYIKIDGSIIKNIDLNQDSYMITRAIVSFTRDLGIKTIAEFVHSKDIFDICKELGVDEFQGFYLGVPTENVL